MNISKFSEQGYIILRKAISKRLIERIYESILEKKISSTSKSYNEFIKILNKNQKNNYEFLKLLNHILFSKGLIEELLLEKKIYSLLTHLIGRDLSYINDNVLTINLPNKTDSKENYFFKDWHQEIWSGTNVSTVQFWTPLIQKNKNSGQIKIIKNSHQWGHVPHQNRKPLILPEKIKVIETDLNVGDVIIFASTLLHKSAITEHPRLALPILIKNFKYKNYSFEDNRNWKIFSYSETTKIERVLGNHHLSPFRLLNMNERLFEGTLKKNNIKNKDKLSKT